ncbi:MAG TPA: oxidoreductase [Clostridia bacterium]|nr:oxidoreductase [Clostridia bacterium]
MAQVCVGLIGFGLGGAKFHAPLISAEPRMRLKTVVTSRREQLAHSFPGVAAAAAPDELFTDPEIELVVVCSPSATHAALAEAALEAGKHVVVDKPFAVTLDEADELLAIAASRGRLISVFHNRRWDDNFRTVCESVRRGDLGRVVYFESHYDRFRPEVKPGWREETGPGAGVFYDLGPHLIDQALVLFGPPKSITADIGHLRSGAIADDYFHLILQYESMRAVLHSSTLVYRQGPRFMLHGEGGSLLTHGFDSQEQALARGMRPGMAGFGMPNPGSQAVLSLADGSEKRLEMLPGSYATYYAGIAAALLDGTPPPVTPQEGRDSMLVLDCGLRSARERRTIDIP